MYPKRVDKLDAEKAWKAATKGADAETIIAGAKRYAIERANEPPKYTKHPARWLRAGSWTDEPAASANGPPIIDGITGDILEQPPRRNGHDREETWEEIGLRVLAEGEGRDGQ